MNQERARIKSQLAELKENRMRLMTAIQANLGIVKNILAGYKVRKIEEIDIEAAHLSLSEATGQKKELMQVRKDIATLEAELE